VLRDTLANILPPLTSGVNFINVLHTAFTHKDPKSVKRWQLDLILTLLGATGVKAACKYVDEIGPWWLCHSPLLEWPLFLWFLLIFLSGLRVTSEEDDPTPVDMDEIKTATFSDPGVNFTKILWAPFSHDSVFCNFYLLTVLALYFFGERISEKKAACKIDLHW